jgi:hypothetical protein
MCGYEAETTLSSFQCSMTDNSTTFAELIMTFIVLNSTTLHYHGSFGIPIYKQECRDARPDLPRSIVWLSLPDPPS